MWEYFDPDNMVQLARTLGFVVFAVAVVKLRPWRLLSRWVRRG